MTCATCILSCDPSEPDVTVHQPTNLSIFRWKRSHGIDNRHSSPQWTTMEILIWRRLSDEQTSDDVGQIGSYDDQMISVSIRILLRRGTGDIKAAIELKSFQKLEGAWKTLEGSGKTSRAAFSRWTNRLVGVWKKRECRLGNLICWETYSICKLQCLINVLNPKTYLSSLAKHSLLLLICTFPSPVKENISRRPKNKLQKFNPSATWISSPAR